MDHALAAHPAAPAGGFPTTADAAIEANRAILARRYRGHSWRIIRTDMHLTFEQVLRLAYRIDDVLDELSGRP